MGIKVSQLTQDSSPTPDDYVLAVDNGTNSSKKVTMGNLVSSGSDAMLKSRDETITGNKTLADGTAIILGSATGSKIGTDTAQKLAFYNSTPIVQPTGNIITALQNLGLVASGSLTESNITSLTSDLALKAPLASPALTGTPTAPTASAATNSTQVATTAYADALAAATLTLTNKRITKRTGTAASSATPTINTDNVDYYSLTAQAADITSFTTNLSGTPTEGQTLWIAITGTAARAITWGASFEASTVALPTTTVTTNRLDVGFIWNSASSHWRCVASA